MLCPKCKAEQIEELLYIDTFEPCGIFRCPQCMIYRWVLKNGELVEYENSYWC